MIEEALFGISEALLVPVLVLTVAALAMVIVELGSLLVEVRKRRHRNLWELERAVEECRGRLAAGMPNEALAALLPFAWNERMEDAMAGVIEQYGRPHAEARIAKRLAEFDYLSLRRLERSRILVRMGPALGLMGTLIPLSPALAGLADGDVATLTENLRVAFSVTVAGLLIGAFAFGISLVRDRLYAQDYSDVEYVAASLTATGENGVPAAPHSHWAVAP